MCEKNFAFWCCALLLLVRSSSKSQENSTNNEEKNDNLTVRYELDMNSTTNYGDEIKTLDLYEKFTNNTQYDEMQYEFHTTSTSNNREDDDSIQYKLDEHSIQNHEDDVQIPMKSHANSRNVSHQRNITSQEVYGNLIENNGSMSQNSSEDSNKSNIVPYDMCDDITCIQLCCSLGDRLDEDLCIPEEIKYSFPNVYGYTNDSFQGENKRVDELFQLVVHDPCQGNDRLLLPEGHQYDYKIFANGSLYLSYYQIFAKSTSYCLAVVDGDKLEVTICSETSEILKTINNNDSIYDVKIIYVSFHIVSILLLVSVFLVYSILPELRNVHGFMLRNYSGALFVAYIIDIVNIIIKADNVQHSVCITIAFFHYFLFLTSFFWLIMISFNMWWTFRGFCSLQRNARQRGKKKLVYYAIYAWGCPFIFAIISVIMDTVSKDIPKILQPEFLEGDCWFRGKEAFALYYYGLKSVCIISSICLSIATALKIARYEEDTGLRLSDSESERYNDNKKWFNLYLKLFIVLFIVMGIKWSIMTVSWLSGDTSNYFSYVINLMDIMQNLCIFIIFVWKKKIKRMLLKRFDCGLFPKAGCEMNVTSSTCTTSEVSLQEKRSFCKQENHHEKGEDSQSSTGNMTALFEPLSSISSKNYC